MPKRSESSPVRMSIKELKVELSARGIATDHMLMRSELENALLENPVVPKAKVPKPNNPSPAKASRGSPYSGKVPSPAAADYGKQGLGGDKDGRFKGYAHNVFHIKRIGPLVAVEGRGTFDRRQVLRRAGGKWDANAKSWTFMDT